MLGVQDLCLGAVLRIWGLCSGIWGLCSRSVLGVQELCPGSVLGVQELCSGSMLRVQELCSGRLQLIPGAGQGCWVRTKQYPKLSHRQGCATEGKHQLTVTVSQTVPTGAGAAIV